MITGSLAVTMDAGPLIPHLSFYCLVKFAADRLSSPGRPHSPEWPMVTAAYALGLMDMREIPVDVEISDEIDAKVAARVFNWAYLSGARAAVVRHWSGG
jgi:hypothetical protein